MGRQVVVSDSVYELVKTFICETSGTFHKGNIKETIENAVRHYVRIRRQRVENTRTHVHEKFDITRDESKIPKKLLKQRDMIVAYLEREYYNADLLKQYEIERVGVNLAHLEEAIRYVIGNDRRTIDTAKKNLKLYRLIKVIDTNRFEFSPFYEDLMRQKQKAEFTGSDEDNNEYVVDVEGIKRRQRECEEKTTQEQKQDSVFYASVEGLEHIVTDN